MSIDSTARPTVGRDDELAQLELALDALDGGSSACLAVEGEAGIGKTRLLAELRRRAEDRGCLVLSGSAAEFERELPFSVWTDALDAYVASQDLGLDGDRDAELLTELAGILPSLRGAGDTGAPPLADERYRAHRAVRSLLGLLAAQRALVLVLDDLHWSDTASIELLAALVRRGTAAPVLFALGFRPGQKAGLLASALAVPAARRIALGPLSEAEAAELLRDLDARAASDAYRHGGGNPFYLEQLARATEGPAGTAALQEEGAAGVPPAVAASLAEELGSLSAAERGLLEAASVAGEPFEPDLAAVIAGQTAAEALTALDGLLALDLVRPTHVPRRFAFRHPLVRRAVYESVPGGRRLAAHALAADALAARGAAAAERAHHVEQSAAPGDEDAIALLLEAGAASAARAPGAAAHWLLAALRLLPAQDAPRQVEVRMALARAQRSQGDLERCRTTLLDALELLPPDSTAERVELTARCASIEHWLGRHEEAHRRLTGAWEALPDRESPAAAALQIELAVDGLYELDFEGTLAMGRGALEAARAGDDRLLTAAAAAALCLGEVAAGRTEDARAHRAEAVALVERLSDAELAPRLEALYHLGWAENYLEHYDDAASRADRGIAIARATGEGRLLVPMMLVKGYTFEMQGRLAEAIDLCEAAVEATRLSATPHDLSWALFELAFAAYHAGDLDGAIAAAEESAQVGGRLAGETMPAGGGGPGWVLSMSLFEAGEVERAWEMMRGLGDDDLLHKIPVERNFDWEVLALVELARGHRDAAESYVRRSEAHAELLALQLPRALALRGRATLLLADGNAAEAAALSLEAADVAASIGARLPAAFCNALAGRALAAAGDRPRAITTLRLAESELSACGSIRVRDEMRRELRRLGARAEPRGPATGADAGVASLTRRELQIADLVTDRHTNREIAGTLFLSEKTVESHMRNIFVKLSVSSRVDVARAIERDRQDHAG